MESWGWVQETHNFMSLPLMVKPNALIAVGSNAMRPDYATPTA